MLTPEGGTVALLTLTLWVPSPSLAQTTDKEDPYDGIDVSDDTLAGELDGFERGFAEVNGTRLHYVEGGEGTPVILMPGWPQTWWAFHKIVPALAETHHVIAVDLRGMGASDKPEGGYDKVTMATDIHELIQSLGHEQAHIVGHDIGSHVAYPFSVLYAEATLTATYLDVAGLPASVADLTLLPREVLAGSFNEDFFIWWFAFHQLDTLPEELIEGRAHIYQGWFWDSLLRDQNALTERDRAVYANAHNTPEAIGAGNGWYRAFPRDLEDNAGFPEMIDVPSLGVGGLGYGLLSNFMQARIVDPQLVHLEEQGHYLAEEAPEEVTRLILEFIESVEEQ